MPTCDCGFDEFSVIDNYLTCLGCGTCIEYAPVYTFSYNHPYNTRPKAYYCRVKRFRQYVKEQKQVKLSYCMDKILDLYNYVVFFWGITKGDRRYFFSRKVMLFFIVQKLDLGVKTPVLKDKERTETQLNSIEKLILNGETHGMKEPGW